jgi:putative transposase
MPHHVTARGNRRGSVFFSAEDRQQFLIWLREHADRYGLSVWAYCLMTNHVHLVVVPQTEASMGQVLRTLLMRHSQRTNAQQRLDGHLWHSRYYSCPLDAAHLWAAVRYVELNPVRAGLVTEAAAFPWSSAGPHAGLRPDPVLSPDLPLLKSAGDWRNFLAQGVPDATVDLIRRRTLKGLPCGDPAFMEHVAEAAGRTVGERRRGRPRRTAPAGQPRLSATPREPCKPAGPRSRRS